MKLLDNVLWWYTNGADEESGTRVDDNVNQIVQLALGVVVARASCQQMMPAEDEDILTWSYGLQLRLEEAEGQHRMVLSDRASSL